MSGYLATKRHKTADPPSKSISLSVFSSFLWWFEYRSFWLVDKTLFHEMLISFMWFLLNILHLFFLRTVAHWQYLRASLLLLPYFLMPYGKDWHTSLHFLKVIIFALGAFLFLRKWLLCVVMQFSISFYSLIVFGVQLR